MPYVQAEPAEHTHKLTMLLDVNAKQIGQLSRDWHAIVDVVDVRAGAPVEDAVFYNAAWTKAPMRPAGAAIKADAASA
jgi:hypothetical protein